ncbi:peptide chain release factor 3 [Acidomonas methanolica]|uniref:Peptide chain release factor 3 n=1 Tax=Acidomonas methanolica NBRC 104435 TaxID=1231351 RepID=A0A023D1Z6_ACIMT|nr:peptide chain release factor 3 [Acidomonas methanolica]MBU2654930.1 peptide chain release factor 3 [Acidomonas methanolica]TCS26281.1 peptide chain release factor 3 [Acidomonas methanolica]GAJ27775.1 translation peptide chain release factor 3 (RF-3) [Acidomonas methanolica NBRC 104435]GBQ52482.1 translation peptide chain release factor 3 [Acidomonas methanolica]GEK99188.1 peptide chain release factor 3 [Acidomonas methanolica NBRC 104435]
MSDTARITGEIARRRTFAIISHPDAGKTTLTERILRAGGAIQMAGNVRAKGERRRTRSDWMGIERDRGISVVTSVMTFEYGGCVFNLLDTPGHEDFSEDTYRTLTAVDCAVMVIDAAKGIEDRTRKLFEICRLRDIPIVTFINKMDREAQDCFALLDEISSTLALDTSPATWPVGRAAQFAGTYDLRTKALHGAAAELPQSDARMVQLSEELELVQAALPEFERESFDAGHLTPVFFGSAMKEIGVTDLLDALVAYGPAPRAQPSESRAVRADEDQVTALIFKIQANMDPNHRDRMAFARVCSGRLTRGMRLKHVRTGKPFALHTPQFFFARDRQLAEEAFGGDVVGIPNHGTLRIGDTLTENEDLRFTGVPHFAPEILRRVRLDDAMKAKKLRQALVELAEEGVVQLFRPQDGLPPIVGVVGTLQLDVLQSRLQGEYGVAIGFESTPFSLARWITGDRAKIEAFCMANRSAMADDLDGDPVFLASSAFMMRRTTEMTPDLAFHAIKQIGVTQG